MQLVRTATQPHIGVLSIHGSFAEHVATLQSMKIPAREVKTLEALAQVQGLIIPGGESTTIGKLMRLYGLSEEIQRRAGGAKPTLAVWGTCAGAILLAERVENHPPDGLKLMDMTIVRNAYGRQVDSFTTELNIPVLGTAPMPAVFIRAPQVTSVGPKAEILAYYENSPVMVRQGSLLATMFHPELTEDTRLHEYFVSLIP